MGCSLTNGGIIIEITPEEFQKYWLKAREKISSSYSGINFSHYKAAGKSTMLLSFFVQKISLVAR
jgi:hypothetical protein